MSSSPATAPSGQLQIAYDVAGDEADPPIVLIPGLGAQLIFYEDEFVQGLVDRYFRVIRVDNRDCGLSSAVDAPPVDTAALLAGTAPAPPYRFADMAGDVIAVLDHLGIDRAHVLGTSLGGMIAQVLAVEHPERVASLTVVSSTSGAPDVGLPTPEALAALLAAGPDAPDRAAAIAFDVATRGAWATPEYYDLDWAAEYFGAAYDRARNPDGTSRQMAALFAEPDREAQLRTLDVPTLVVHGTADPLIAPSGGERLAELIDGAELLLLEGMAHDLPPHYWAPLIEAVTRLVVRAGP